MSDLAEAQIALAALLDAAPGIPVCVSLTFERRKRGFFTVMGNRLEEALPALAAAGATAVGANCTLTSADFVPLAAAARAAYPGPLILQPNAGAPRLDEGLALYDQSPGEFAADLAGIVESVGGTARGQSAAAAAPIRVSSPRWPRSSRAGACDERTDPLRRLVALRGAGRRAALPRLSRRA